MPQTAGQRFGQYLTRQAAATTASFYDIQTSGMLYDSARGDKPLHTTLYDKLAVRPRWRW